MEVSLDIWTYTLSDWGNSQGLVSHDLKDPVPLIFFPNFRLRTINFFGSAEKTALITCEITLPDAPNPVIISKNSRVKISSTLSR